MTPRRVLPLVAALLACLVIATNEAEPAAADPARAAGTDPAKVLRGTAKPGKPNPAYKPVRGKLTMVYGDNHVFGVVPPRGWVVDDSSGLGAKIRVVLYPRGQKWETAPTVMYSNPLHQDPGAHKSLLQMIERDIMDFRKHAPNGKVTSGAPVYNVHNQRAELRYFSPEGGDTLSAVAYYEEKDMVMLLVLESKTAAGFRGALPGFTGMVGSYQFIASSADAQNHPEPGNPR